MIKTGEKLVPKRGNSLSGFTAYKIYTVIAGTGDTNLSPASVWTGHHQHSENSCNVIDDFGHIRFVTLDFFRSFNLEMGTLFNDTSTS